MIPVRWEPREPPLEPRAVAGWGDVAAALLARLARCGDERLARLTGVAGDGVVVVLGAAEDLPWVDGAIWLGADPEVELLLVPTALRCDVPATWLARRLGGVAGPGPVAVLPAADRVVPLAAARRVDRRALTEVAL